MLGRTHRSGQGCELTSQLPSLPSFTALENVEGPPPPGSQAAEELQQEINAQSLEKVQQYYRKLRYLRGRPWGPGVRTLPWGVGHKAPDGPPCGSTPTLCEASACTHLSESP